MKISKDTAEQLLRQNDINNCVHIDETDWEGDTYQTKDIIFSKKGKNYKFTVCRDLESDNNWDYDMQKNYICHEVVRRDRIISSWEIK